MFSSSIMYLEVMFHLISAYFNYIFINLCIILVISFNSAKDKTPGNEMKVSLSCARSEQDDKKWIMISSID